MITETRTGGGWAAADGEFLRLRYGGGEPHREANLHAKISVEPITSDAQAMGRKR
jgi:hypothetical protein